MPDRVDRSGRPDRSDPPPAADARRPAAGRGRERATWGRGVGLAGLLAALAAGSLLTAPFLAPPLRTSPLGAQSGAASVPFDEARTAWRFPVGERAEYAVTFGPVRVGRAELRVEGIDTVRAGPAYRVAFELEGGPFFYKIDDRTVSWVAPDPIRSLRFEQRLKEGDYRRHRRYTFDPGGGTYTRLDWDEEAGRLVPHPEERGVRMPEGARRHGPLDEIAYLYLARTVPLEPGRTYRFERYFEEEGNPVILEVLRRERVRVPAGRFETVVVRPVIHTDGMFGEGGRAELYLTDDDRRVIVQLKTKMKAGTMNMYLREYEPGRPDGWIGGPPGP